MKNKSSTLISIFFLGFLLLIASSKLLACSTSLVPPHYVVQDAEVIVRAVAEESDEDQRVKFKVQEIIKGENVPPYLMINGSLTENDGFNRGVVPYWNTGRSTGGLCHNYKYKNGGEYLLLLKESKGQLIPYWRSLAPVNEQIHSADDEWVKWVKEHLNWVNNATALQKVELTFEMYQRYGFDTKGELIWRYIFTSSSEEHLQKFAKHLEHLGYSFAKISKIRNKENLEEFELRVEKIQKLSPAMLILRNEKIKALADDFGVKNIGWNVGKVK